MLASETITDLLARQGRSKRSLALELGISPQALEHRLSSTPRIDTLSETLSPLGYELVAVPVGTDVEGGFKLDG